jgi:DNA-binding XRE family transcriptional regulator
MSLIDSKEDPITQILKNSILQSQELADVIDQRAEYLIKSRVHEQTLTRKQMAEKYQVSPQSIARLSKDELRRLGFKLIKVGVQVRYDRIDIVGTSRETYRRVKMNKQ